MGFNAKIDRRKFVVTSASALAATPALSWPRLMAQSFSASPLMDLYVSPQGNDGNPGTIDKPFRTIRAAQMAVRTLRASASGAIAVYLRIGTHYLDEALVFTPEDSGREEAPILYAAYPGERGTISGGARLDLKWTPYRNGIMRAKVPDGTKTDQLFINGKAQILARYPNYDANARYLNGYAADALSTERVKTWANPKGGYIHALHRALWGDMHYQITGKDGQGDVTYEGGWQNNRPGPMHNEYRFVEGIFEELDAPGEWFLDEDKSTLYYYPPKDVDLKTAVVEIVRLKHLIEFQGSASAPVRWITLDGLVFQHAARTFMEIREPLLRSDWRIYRGGAVFLTGTEDCGIDRCHFDQLGGNAVFVSQYNRRARVSRCHISDVGGNGVCFVGDRAAVRNPLDNYNQRLSLEQLDLTPGPQTPNYPSDCVVDDSLIYRTGRTEKQSAPIEIDMAISITVRHVSIYDVPRAGINIGDGCWGGHHIDGCDIFDTVKETGDHGSFNSWGRDRWWGLKGVDLDTVVDSGQHKDLPVLDAALPIALTNSRWRCDHGWDIDLDDGSSNYHITNNLCLNGGLKLREGFYRTCENNVLVNNSLHAHVWYQDSHDIFRKNIVFATYQPVHIRTWGQEIDYNLIQKSHAQKSSPAVPLQAQTSQDKHSVIADALFISPQTGDYGVRPDSPALALGFVNFDMASFGVQAPELKAIAKQPLLPDPYTPPPPSTIEARSRTIATWAGAKVRNVSGLDEVSALGAPGESGVLVLETPQESAAAQAGIQPNDVILAVDTRQVNELQDLLRATQAAARNEAQATVTVLRQQQQTTLHIAVK